MATVVAEAPSAEVEDAWQTIAGLRLRLGRNITIHKHHYRGMPWLIIADQKNESYFRCSGNVEQFLNLLDGSRSVEQALDQSAGPGFSSLQQQDVILLIANLKSAGLLEDGVVGNDDHSALKPKPSRWRNPFALKFPLLDPDHFLQRTAYLFKPLFSPLALVIWACLVVVALATVALHWHSLVEHGAARFADPQNLLWYWLLYPLVKALHEFGHAYATRLWGGAVHEIGIMLLVFFPVPYVDSSTSHQFSSKHRRLVVCASGIMVEVLLAAIALLVWVNSDHGLVHDLAFDIFIIGGISTLLFNANPLLRFDGYYLLSELIEIPNLGTRSDQYLAYLFKHYLLGMPDQRSPVTAPGEKKWLVTYGILARIYRVFITLFIAFWVASKFLVVGTLLALWAIMGQIILPFARGFYRLVPQVLKVDRFLRFTTIMVVFWVLLLSGLFIPISHSTYTQGVVSLPENAFIRAGADGLVARVQLADGEAVNKDRAILQLENLELEARRQSLQARLVETQARQQQVFLRDRSRADVLKTQVSAIEADIKDVEEQLDNLRVVSTAAGVVSLPMADDLLGRYVKRGDVIGYVTGQSEVSALVAIPQRDIDVVRQGMSAIEVRLSSQPTETLAAEFLRELPQATDRLPNRILGSAAGGAVATDARDASGTQLLSNIFLVEIALPLEMPGNYLGQRIHVRFVHQDESIGNRLVRRLNQFLLQPPFV